MYILLVYVGVHFLKGGGNVLPSHFLFISCLWLQSDYISVYVCMRGSDCSILSSPFIGDEDGILIISLMAALLGKIDPLDPD